jgi:carbonic anhydrase
MKSTFAAFAIGLAAASGAVLAAGEQPGHGTHWGYAGAVGPDKWTSLKPEFAACAGRNQSPVDIAGTIEAELKPVQFDYADGGAEVINNGHTIQVNYVAGSSITVDGIRFDLKQFHFHAPSENRIGGKSFPLEAHLVHADKDGNLAVVAVLFDAGGANPAIGAAWSRMPKAEGGKNPLPQKVAAAGLLPAERDYYRYNGSLTTPPCTEGVRWIVMKKPMTVSREQVEAFRSTLGFANNRPVQPVNARPVLQ